MSRIRQIRLEQLNEDLNKLEKDYNAVAEKKRRESNPQEQNNLQLQLDNIAKRMEEVERDIENIKQPEKEKDNIQSLVNLLTLYENEIFICVKKAYQACSPEDWQNPLPDDLEGILAELKKMPSGISKYTILEKFIAQLILDSEMPQSISQELRMLAENSINGYLELFDVILAQKNKSKNTKPYLMVWIRRSEQDSVKHQNQEDYYFVDAWLIPNGDSYNYSQNSEFIKLHKSHNVNDLKGTKDKNKNTFTLEKIPQEIIDCLKKIGDYSSDRLTIEIFLPLDLINQAVDNWGIEDGFMSFPEKLGNLYKVIVRSSERLEKNYSYKRAFWKDKWTTLQKVIQNSANSTFILWDDDDLNNLYAELSEANVIGVKWQTTPVQMGKDSVFAVILRTATPVALWLRYNLFASNNEQVNELLNCCISQLPETVRKKRKEAFSKSNDEHIGHHLSLLWEDPNRLPPTIDYFM
ncbi:MAG: hypothetical protein KME64_42180 [Scytonematopsis contorta HA4267-MV1]|jgi:hypothetical protein|nr:hypothetical protein [Scytonematopsis contorta HA4267-MV1]